MSLPRRAWRTAAAAALAVALLAGCQGPAGGQPSPSGSSAGSVPEPAVDELLAADWPMAGGGARHASARSPPPPGVEQAEWTAGLPAWPHRGPFEAPRLALAGATLLAARAGQPLVALGLGNGTVRWAGAGADVEAVAADGLVFTADGSHVRALDAGTGTEAWSMTVPDVRYEALNFTSGQPVTSLAYGSGRLYVGTLGPTAFALDARSGGTLWSARDPGWEDGGGHMDGPAVLAGGTLYLATQGKHLHAMDPATGAILWTRTVGEGPVSAPAAADGRLTAAMNNLWENLEGLHAGNGSTRWSARIPARIPHPPVVSGDTVLVYSWDNRVHALAADDGRALWSFRTGDAADCTDNWVCQRASPAPAALDDAAVVPGADGVLYVLRLGDGSVVRAIPLPGSAWGTPLLAGDFAYVGVDDAVHAVRWRG